MRNPAQVPAITIRTDPFVYPERAASLTTIRFSDLKYKLGNEWIPLKNGRYSYKGVPYGGLDADLDDVWLFDKKGEDPQYALVSISVVRYGGSSSPEGYVLLFAIRNGRLVRLQQLTYDAQAPGTGAKFDSSKSTLTVIERSNEGAPNCCPSHVDVVTYSWTGKLFQRATFEVRAVQSK